jgi:HlyD family secretion protein
MKNRRTLIIVVIVLVLLIGGYYGVRAFTGANNAALTASGTIEATTVNVSPELAGKVEDVLVDEGQTVKTGDPLFHLDDTLLKAQQAAALAGLGEAKSAALTAQAAYESAQAQFDIANNAARAQAHSTRLQDWLGKTPDYFDQPKWYFTQDEQITAAQVELAAAQDNLTATQAKLDAVISDLKNSSFLAAEARLENARIAYLVARQVQVEGQAAGSGKAPNELDATTYHIPDSPFSTYRVRIHISQNLANNASLANETQIAYNAATTELNHAETAYNALLNSAGASNVLRARAALAVANERVQVAQDNLTALQSGDNSPQVAGATAALAQSKSGAQQAQDAVAQAQANLDLLNAQMSKLEVDAPQDGVILTRNIEPGEYVQPGADALSMANIASLTITVYVPEDQYGKIRLGLNASVSVDSFPGQKFNAAVSYISDQAEFTPRNVQTVEGRSSTVYAVKLKVNDPQGKLKPGMPADVVFSTE